MQAAIIKLRYLYLPYLLLLIVLTAAYTFLHRLLALQWHWLAPGTWLVLWILPSILAVLMVLLCLFGRVRLLDLRTRRGDGRWVFLLAVSALVAGPVVSVQYFLADWHGQLVSLRSPEQVGGYPYARYVALQTYKTDLAHNYRKHFVSSTGGRSLNSPEYAYDVVIAVPLYTSGAIAKASNPLPLEVVSTQGDSATVVTGTTFRRPVQAPVWVCWHYRLSSRSELTAPAREARAQRFADTVYQSWLKLDHDGFTYLRRPLDKHLMGQYLNTVQSAAHSAAAEIPIFEPVYEPFSKRADTSRTVMVVVGIAACGVMLAMVLYPPLDERRSKRLQQR